MTTSEYPKTFTKESTGQTRQVSTIDDEVRAKFDGYREDVEASGEDAYASDDAFSSGPPSPAALATRNPRRPFRGDAS